MVAKFQNMGPGTEGDGLESSECIPSNGGGG